MKDPRKTMQIVHLSIIKIVANARPAAAGRVLLDFMFAIRSHVQWPESLCLTNYTWLAADGLLAAF